MIRSVRIGTRRRGACGLCLLALGLSLGVAIAAEEDVPGPPPGSYRILGGGHSVTLPFEVYHGDIRIAGKVNGHDVLLLVDNGFLWDEIAFFSDEGVGDLGLVYDGEGEVGGVGEGDKVPSRTASGITLEFPGVVFTDQPAIVMPATAGFARMWDGAIGQVSAVFFKNFVTDFDFDAMVLTLTEPAHYVPRAGARQLPLIHTGNNSWAVPATLTTLDGRATAMNVTMDLGTNEWLTLGAEGEHRLGVPAGARPATLGWGIQGEIRGFQGRLRAFDIAGWRIDDLLAEFVPGDYRASIFHEATLGLGLLRMFNFAYDYPERRMYLVPNADFNRPTERDMTGAVISPGEGGTPVISRIEADSPAAEAGLAVGDEILRIDGRSTAGYDRFALRPLLQRAGARVTFTVRRGGREREFILTLRRLV